MSAIVFLNTALWFVLPAYASLIACGDAEQILADAQRPAANPAALADAMPSEPPEPGAQYAFGFAMNLDQTASSRHDPHTREQLIRSGYLGGHVKVWLAADGRGIEADVMEFTAPEGAVAYQAEVTRHACEYANEAFEAPLGGIGLQVRYETGDPIVEQVSWVAGNRRTSSSCRNSLSLRTTSGSWTSWMRQPRPRGPVRMRALMRKALKIARWGDMQATGRGRSASRA